MNSKHFTYSRKLLFLTLISASLLNFITDTTGIHVMYFDDASILLMFGIVCLYKKNLDFSSFKWPIIFIIISLISLVDNLVNSYIINYFIQIKNYLLPFLIFVIASAIYDESSYKRYVKYYLNLCVLLSIIGILEFILNKHFYLVYGVFGNPSSVNPFRSYSLIGSPVDFGLILILPIIFTFLFYSKKYITLLHSLTLLFTKSLSMISLILVIMVAGLKFKIIPKRYFIYICLVGTLSVFYNEGIMDRILTKQDVVANYNVINESSRYDMYMQSKDIVKDNFFLGAGAGNFGGWVSDKDNAIYEAYNFNFYSLKSIDLFYLHLIGELGIFGLISFLMIFLSIIFKNITYMKFSQKYNNHYGFVLSGTVFLYGICLLVTGFSCMILETNFATIPFYFLAAFSMCYHNSIDIKKNENL